ncbi:MAG: DsbA family protein [Deltaproteobacteria bacterium]|nr:DsbA family protein [Deltaproteobacteria bacterium]
MQVSSETKVFLGIAVVTVLVIVGGALMFSQPAKTYGLETLAPSTAWATGSATPRSTLVEFSDFECPSCKAAEPVVDDLIAKYSSQGLRFVYRHYPLPQHLFAMKAAEAAEAAGKQGKFWEMRSLLFQNQDALSDDLFPKLAGDMGLNLDQFKKDMNSEEVNKKVLADQADGNAVGVNATPTFFLNGKKVDLTSLGDLETLVANSLK